MKNKKEKHFLTRVLALLIAAVLSVTVAGCGTQDEINEIVNANSGTQATDNLVSDNSDAGNTAMGRYVGRDVNTFNAYGRIFLTKMNDGTLTAYDEYASFYASAKKLADPSEYDVLAAFGSGIYTSDSSGDSWEQKELGEEYDWLIDTGITWVGESQISGDGTIVLEYTTLDDDNENELNPHYMFIDPDGTRRDFELVFTDDEKYITNFCFDENGRLFATTFGENIYEINTQDASLSVVTTYAGVSKRFIRCHNNVLMFQGSNELKLYDLVSKSYITDPVLDDFIEENQSFGMQSPDIGCKALAFFGEEDNVIYLAFEKGLYRHIIGGSAVEQVIDGSTSAFSDPSHILYDAIMLNNQEFLVQFSDNRLVKFSYDAQMPTVPSDKLLVYSLEENDTIKQAISAYQTQYPDVLIEYQIGINGDAVTREGALKNLNTELLSGEGPDVLVLEGISAESYANQGILQDLSSLVDAADAQDGIFKSIIEPFYTGNSLYMLPVEFTLPALAGHSDIVKSAGSIKDMAELTEQLREEYPERDLLAIASASGILKKFVHISAPSWIDDKGNINESGIKEYLEQAKRIYNAQMSGLTDEMTASYKSIQRYYERTMGIDYEDGMGLQDMTNDVNLSSGSDDSRYFVFGEINSMMSFAGIITLPKNSGFENTIVMPVSGNNGSIYVPKTIVGINAASKNSQNSEQFVSMLMSTEVQDITHYGLPINKKSFENIFIVDPDRVGSDGEIMLHSWSDEYGNSFERTTYLPTDEQMQTFKNWIEQADTPYIKDSVLEEAVLSEGENYLVGKQELDTAMKAIMDKAMIYVAE